MTALKGGGQKEILNAIVVVSLRELWDSKCLGSL